MPILIPSKNIYNKNNPKVIKNILQKIEFKGKKHTEEEKINETLVNEEFKNFDNAEIETNESSLAYNFNRPNGDYNKLVQAFSYIKVIPIYFDVAVFINKYNPDKSVLNLSADEEGHYLKISLNLSKETGQSSANLKFGNLSFNAVGNFYDEYIIGAYIDKSTITTDYTNIETATEIPTIFPTYTYTQENLTTQIGSNATATANSNFENKSYISNSFSYNNELNRYEFGSSKILCGVEIIKLGYGSSIQTTNPSFQNTGLLPSQVIMYGECVKYTPRSITISVNGDYFTITEKDFSISAGKESSTKSIIIGENNPFFQYSNWIKRANNILTQEEYYKEFSNSIFETFSNGRETATVLCSVSDYYKFDNFDPNKKGKKEISIDKSTGKMTFSIGDKVLPMVYEADGQETPMSLKNGLAKYFEVCGVKKYYDGAVWQELSLIEAGTTEFTPRTIDNYYLREMSRRSIFTYSEKIINI